MQRVIPNCAAALTPLRDIINKKFLPTVIGGSISDQEKTLFSLPARMGGLGVRDPVESAQQVYWASRKCTGKIISAIKGDEAFTVQEHWDEVAKSHAEVRLEQIELNQKKPDEALEPLEAKKRCAVTRAVGEKNSNWSIDFSAVEFRDALAMRYSRPLLGMSAECDGCGAMFDLQHALDCRKGGLITQRHNEVRDALGDIAALAYKDVIREPIVKEADDARAVTALVADLGVRGMRQPQTEMLIDVRVVDTDAPSHAHRTVSAVLATAGREKKRKYAEAAEARRASFSPFVLSVDGVNGA